MKKIKAIDLINNSQLTEDYFTEAEKYFEEFKKMETLQEYNCDHCHFPLYELIVKYQHCHCPDCNNRMLDCDCIVKYCNCTYPINQKYNEYMKSKINSIKNDQSKCWKEMIKFRSMAERLEKELKKATIEHLKQERFYEKYIELHQKNERTNNQSSNQQKENSILQEEAKEKE